MMMNETMTAWHAAAAHLAKARAILRRLRRCDNAAVARCAAEGYDTVGEALLSITNDDMFIALAEDDAIDASVKPWLESQRVACEEYAEA
jgi:hypothetical protein